MQKLTEAIGYRFHQPALLRQALTHPSMGHDDNQRLEFLGDAVLQYIMSDILYKAFPNEREGKLTHLRALLVCEAALSQVARTLHVGEALIMDKGEALTGGRDKPSVLCDAMEAILAAVYLDGGIEKARELIHRVLLSHIPAAEERRDYKTTLQEIIQRKSGQVLTYHMVGESGPDHNKTFRFEVRLNDEPIGHGSGHSKKEAEQDAARSALEGMLK